MYVLADVPKDILDKLNNIIHQQNKDTANECLAGNLQHEFFIPEGIEILHPFIMALIDAHSEKYPQFLPRARSMINDKECKLSIFNLWVNFQKKYEFNPIHIHDGLYSFVIWHKVPYLMENERANFSNKKEINIRAGKFSFIYSGVMGQIHEEDLPVDKSYEGKIALFPANLNHVVYPFYTSDDFRISISGNIGFQV